MTHDAPMPHTAGVCVDVLATPRRCEACGSFIAEDGDGIGQQETNCGRHCVGCCECDDDSDSDSED